MNKLEFLKSLLLECFFKHITIFIKIKSSSFLDLVHKFCNLEVRKGPCRAIFRRYFFNTETKNCEEFIYGGCYGNANNFFTKQECEYVCKSRYYFKKYLTPYYKI